MNCRNFCSGKSAFALLPAGWQTPRQLRLRSLRCPSSCGRSPRAIKRQRRRSRRGSAPLRGAAGRCLAGWLPLRSLTWSLQLLPRPLKWVIIPAPSNHPLAQSPCMLSPLLLHVAGAQQACKGGRRDRHERRHGGRGCEDHGEGQRRRWAPRGDQAGAGGGRQAPARAGAGARRAVHAHCGPHSCASTCSPKGRGGPCAHARARA